MAREPKEPILSYWYQALSSPYGIEIACSEADSVRTTLYIVRREAKDPDLDQIKLTISPFDPTKIWLVKKEPANETP